MAFLKKVFSPGSSKDDEMRSQPTGSEASGPYTEGVPSGENAPALHTKPESEDHGISRQILNPDGKKYDEFRHGETATTDPTSSRAPTTAGGATALHSQPEAEKDRGIARQIFGKRDDDVSYGTTATADRDLPTQTTGNKPVGALDTPIDTSRLDLDPNTMSQQKYEDQRYDPSSTTAPGMATSQPPERELLKDNQSALSMKSGVLGPYAQEADNRPAGSTIQNLPERTFPLGGGVASENTRPTSSVYSDTSRNPPVDPSTSGTTAPTSTFEYLDPSTTSSAPKESSGLRPGSGSAAVAAAGNGAAAASGMTAMREHQHKGHGHQYDGDPCPPGDEPQLTGPKHVPGPHSTMIANLLDPALHVPGEFPNEDGTDPHQHSAMGFGSSSGPGAGGMTEVVNDRNVPTSTGIGQPKTYQPTGSKKEHHYGRDAALVGGAGAAGLGAYELSKDRDTPATSQPSSTAPAQSSYETGNPAVPSTAATSTTQPEKDQHYGRDAAIAGGAGAAGLGAHEAMNGRNAPSTTQPTSSTAPAQSSYETGTSSIPPTSATSTSRPVKEHHYGRDAALAGGAGAAGVGAYEVMNDRNEPSTTQPSSAAPPHSSYETGTSSIPPTSSTTTSQPSVGSNPYSYESLQPREVPSSITSPETASQSKDHHYGRDAALAGSAGAAGYGAYEATRPDERGDTGPASKTIGPHKSNALNVLDPRVKPEPEKMKDHTTAGPWQSDSLNKADPKVTSNPEKAAEKGIGGHGYATFPEQGMQQQKAEPQESHHYGHDAALAGGAGAAGYGAYEAARGRNDRTLPGQEGGPHQTGTANVLDKDVRAQPAAMKEREPLSQQQQQHPEHHYGRDAALVGGSAGAAAYGAHEYDQKEAEKLEKERQKEMAKQQKEHEKEMKKEEKHADKEHKKEEKAAEKQHEKDVKAAEKEREKEREKHEKVLAHEREKMEKERAKEQEKAEKERAKEQEKLEKAREHQAKVAEVDGHNKLHKDPPEEKEKKPSLIHRILHPHEKEKSPVGDEAGRSSLEGENRPKGLDYKEADEARHAQNTERLGHEGAAGYGAGKGGESSIMKDPHTGLPVDMSKGGAHGAGGTDGTQQIHSGFEGQGTAMGEGTGGTDWEGIKKANTPY